ncbi:glycine dehydrogenase [Propionibacterium sp. oral taxon 192 str. F0372]|uniref:aminomethyl-transferring glycine dehydrogenase n=1 Tax=Propionibacterium sp. oral taxon 192 TaxID=671222 RepID=UPI0003545C54|nr:glycine dehydrogenase [Propionibacterium sp. oral taxon 192 str. F0372]
MSSFISRHIGPNAEQQHAMCETIQVASLDALIDEVVPLTIRDEQLSLPPARDEATVQQRLLELSLRNNPGRSLIGMGFHGTITPAVLRRNILENPAWYTAYTPYQPEISQGRLEMLLNFQTMIADLTGLPVAGASLLDEATALAEGVSMARRLNRKGELVLVEEGILPSSLAVLRTRMNTIGIEVVVCESAATDPRLASAFAVVVQTPALDGRMQSTAELTALAQAAHDAGALVVTAADLLALVLVTPPGQWGADIAVGTTQRFGVPLFFGGPHAAYIAAKEGTQRSLPGRLVGVSLDASGAPALRLALQTREQHIRREKATSNICTAQVLLANMAVGYAIHHGPEGLKRIAATIHNRTARLAAAITTAGFGVVHDSFFDTLLVEVPSAAGIVGAARQQGFHLRLADDTHVGISVGEDLTEEELAAVARLFGAVITEESWGEMGADARSDTFLTTPVFHAHHSETSLMRYLASLADRDFALDRGMIPLGSCTMKLNSAASLEPITLPGFANLHPLVPAQDAEGTLEMITELSGWLGEITGYDACSLQPNSGAQGEFAGLSAIRAYHLANGHSQRTICLIPASAHGTNAASAVMAGMKIVVVASQCDGSIDLDDLRAKVQTHRDELAAIMITYPSTHGVFEDTVTTACELVHEAGGQVYVDGANLNALMGLARPGRFGADASHLNLHKTFASPHGGGGPGVGPIVVRKHLAEYLPGDPAAGGATTAVNAARFGSPGILPISYAFIAMMGADGLREASKTAILNANYIASRLAEHYPILYTGASGRVAHECILDTRALLATAGLSIDDIAKRLIDHGFHAPTVSFPVASTLMVEPTESENKHELDRFCDAMIAIRKEIDMVIDGRYPADDNPLVNAPHTQAMIIDDEWSHPYTRRVAAFPDQVAETLRGGLLDAGEHGKYWPGCARVNAAHGDRHLICSCPPVEDCA